MEWGRRPAERNTEQLGWFSDCLSCFWGWFWGGFRFLFFNTRKNYQQIHYSCTVLYKFPLLFTLWFKIMLEWLMVSYYHYKLESNNQTALENNFWKVISANSTNKVDFFSTVETGFP